jgi:uncharacterized repeat protein (TIGR01451 family)
MKSGFGRIGLEGRSHRRPISIAFVLVVISSLLLAVAGPAAADRPFSPRFSQNVQGAITFAANTVMTCPDSDSRCPAAQAGTGSALNNNQFNMRYVDIDGDPATFNSSSAVLTVPSGAQVLFAGLYYDGQTTAGVGGTAAPTPSARGTVRLRVPGLLGFQTLTASVDNSTSGKYAAFVDITDQVTGAGSGSYTVANVQTGTGEDRGGGWSIVVAYRDPSEPARNLTIFDGLETVSQGETKTVGVTGFQTPASGPVRTDVGFVTYEGDRGSTGDSATLNGTVLSSATNPPNNFFNSSISKNGVLLTDKDPDYNNQLGFDAVQVNADGILANGATSAAIRLQTNRDQYMPHVVTFATEIFSPTITDVKTVQNITNPAQPARPGDTLRYTLQYTNSGGDGATQFIATDAIPGGTTYAPGSLKITSGPNAPASPTDAIGDDLAEFLPASNSVRFRLGQGASNTAGGTLSAAGGPATSTTITFEVTVGDLPSGTAISNTGEAEFLSQTLGTPQTAESNTVVNEVIAPDLEMSKSHVVPIVGVDVEFTLGVENVGTASTDGSAVTVTDSFDPSAFSAINITSAPGWNCSATSGLNLSCTRTDVLATGAPYPGIQVTGTVVASPPATFTNEAEVAGGGDNTPGNNLAVDFLPVPPTSSDLSIVKTVAPATVLPGQRITYTLEVTNAGPSNATGVTVEDSWAFSGLIDVTATPSQGTCPTVTTSSVLCEIGNLAAGGTATVEISATVDFDDSSGLLNTASVEGDQADPRPDNNESSATFDAAAASDIEVVKTAGTDPIAGEAFSYTIEVTNNGPSDADGVVVNDQIPELFLPAEVIGPGFAFCSAAEAGGTLSCTYDGPLAVGATATLTLVGTLAPASAGVPVINTASAYSSEADSNPDNNSSSVTVIPLPFADIAMSKTASADSVEAGQTVTWTFIVQNLGPLDADPVILEDELPAGLAIVSLPDGCGVEETTLTCNLGALGLDESRTLALTVRPGPAFAGETITNSASVSSPRPDPNQANQSDTSSFEVTSGKTRLKLDQKVNRKKARSGGKFAFGITVSNTSDTSAYDSVVCQRLPRALKIVRAPGAKIGPGRKACWTIGRLDPDRSRQFSVLTRGFSSRNTSATAPVTLSGENVVDGRQSKTVRIVVPRKPKPPQPVAG